MLKVVTPEVKWYAGAETAGRWRRRKTAVGEVAQKEMECNGLIC